MKVFPTLRFNPEHKQPYTYWQCPSCQRKFDGCSPPRHKPECAHPHQGYLGLILFIGPKGVEVVKRCTEQSTSHYRETECHPILRVSMMMLRQQLPHVLKQKK